MISDAGMVLARVAAGSSPLLFLSTMQGPAFLKLYVGWFLVCWVGVLFLRKAGFDSPVTTLLGLVLYEGLGVARIVLGAQSGMTDWEFLILMMVMGGFLFLIRAKHFDNRRSGSSDGCSAGGTSTSGGGCGGSGCGGGGCGGCGGG